MTVTKSKMSPKSCVKSGRRWLSEGKLRRQATKKAFRKALASVKEIKSPYFYAALFEEAKDPEEKRRCMNIGDKCKALRFGMDDVIEWNPEYYLMVTKDAEHYYWRLEGDEGFCLPVAPVGEGWMPKYQSVGACHAALVLTKGGHGIYSLLCLYDHDTGEMVQLPMEKIWEFYRYPSVKVCGDVVTFFGYHDGPSMVKNYNWYELFKAGQAYMARVEAREAHREDREAEKKQ